MNDLYIHQLETENKQIRKALQECRKALEEEIATKKKAIEYIKQYGNLYCLKHTQFKKYKQYEELLEILGEKENGTITLNTKDMNITGGKYER